jgi:RNA polymerase sigma-70 factor (ECF subfamily)
MFPTRANGQPAAVAYLRASDGVQHAYGVAVLQPTTRGIARISTFGDPALVTMFGYPLIAPTRTANW